MRRRQPARIFSSPTIAGSQVSYVRYAGSRKMSEMGTEGGTPSFAQKLNEDYKPPRRHTKRNDLQVF
jgi:hypothetical protein